MSFSFFYKESLPHPATFIKKDLFERVFLFNENFKIVSDWEFLICAICKFNVTYKHIDIVISDFDACGVSNDANNRPVILKERNEVLHKHFPLFLDDSESLYKMNKYFHLNRFKMLVELEKSFIARKLNSLLMRIQLFLFRNKQIKNL